MLLMKVDSYGEPLIYHAFNMEQVNCFCKLWSM